MSIASADVERFWRLRHQPRRYPDLARREAASILFGWPGALLQRVYVGAIGFSFGGATSPFFAPEGGLIYFSVSGTGDQLVSGPCDSNIPEIIGCTTYIPGPPYAP